MDKNAVFEKALKRIAQVTYEAKQREKDAAMAEMMVEKMTDNGVAFVYFPDDKSLMVITDKHVDTIY